MRKKILLLMIFFGVLYLLIPDGLASIGTAIAPATGSYNFTSDGRTIEFVVYNTGSEDANYTLTIDGTATNFTSIEPTQAYIEGGAYATFKVTIKPTEELEAGETYSLVTTAQVVSPGIITVGAKSNIKLFYLGRKVVAPKVPPPVTEVIELIATGEIGIFSYEVDTGITDIIIEAANAVSNVEIAVTAQVDQPATVLIAVPRYSYLYLIVDKVNIDNADIAKATIKFQVEKAWLDGNEIDPASVALYGYYDDQWDKLATTKLTEDAAYVYYQAESPGVLVFAISGETAVTTTTLPAIFPAVPRLPTGWTVGIAIAVLIIGVIYYRKYYRKPWAPRPSYKRKRR